MAIVVVMVMFIVIVMAMVIVIVKCMFIGMIMASAFLCYVHAVLNSASVSMWGLGNKCKGPNERNWRQMSKMSCGGTTLKGYKAEKKTNKHLIKRHKASMCPASLQVMAPQFTSPFLTAAQASPTLAT